MVVDESHKNEATFDSHNRGQSHAQGGTSIVVDSEMLDEEGSAENKGRY